MSGIYAKDKIEGLSWQEKQILGKKYQASPEKLKELQKYLRRNKKIQPKGVSAVKKTYSPINLTTNDNTSNFKLNFQKLMNNERKEDDLSKMIKKSEGQNKNSEFAI